MPEILTESFCERCGTRYTFESVAPAGKRMGKFKVLSKGLKNFVLDDDSSLDEALAAARGEKDRETTSEQLDAFHKTFNFCMTCRQYTCANCWNDAEGTCLTCAPEVRGNGFGAPLAAFDLNATNNGAPQAWPQVDQLAWPTTDLPVREPEPDPTPAWAAEPEPTAEPGPASVAESETVDAAEPDTVGAAEPETVVAAESAPDLVGEQPPITAPDPDLEREVAAYLSDHEPVLVDAPEPREPAVAAEPAPVAEPGAAAEPAVAAAASLPTSTLDDPVADLRAAATADASSESSDAGESYEVAEATDPHILARLASIAAASEIRSGARVRPKLRAANDAAALTRETSPAAPRTNETPAAPAAEAPGAPTSPLLRKLRPGQSLDAAIEAFEAALGDRQSATATDAAPAEPEVAVHADPPTAAEAPVAIEPDAVAAEDEAPAAEPQLATATEAEPAAPELAASEAETPAARKPDWPTADTAGGSRPGATPRRAAGPRTAKPADDRVEVPTWRIVAPEASPAGTPESDDALPAAASADPATTTPAKPEWPGQPTTDSLAFLATRKKKGSAEGIWAASTRDLLAPANGPVAPAGIQSCVSCGLSLSATARFCRRCGTRQGS